MELLDYAVAPLLRLHGGPETLLAVQAMALASAVFPLGWMGARVLESSRAGLALAVAWLLAPDVHSGVMFDYNPMLLGSAALLWTAWALLCRGTPSSLIAAVVACLAREDLCLYVAVLALVLALRGRRRGARLSWRPWRSRCSRSRCSSSFPAFVPTASVTSSSSRKRRKPARRVPSGSRARSSTIRRSGGRCCSR